VSAVTSPLVVACLRHADHRPDSDPVTAHLTRYAQRAGPAPAEWAALELALRVGEAWGGRVLAVCAGPPDADRTLREARAAGAEVLRVVLPGMQAGGGAHGELEPLETYLDELATDGRPVAAALADVMRRAGRPDLVVCGARSVDRGTGSVPAFLAAELGAAQALGLTRLDVPAAGTGPGDLVGERRLDRGRRERLRIPRPAVVSVEAGGIRLRRAGPRAALEAGAAPVPVVLAEATTARPHRSPARPFRPRTRVVPPPVGPTPRERLLALSGVLAERTPPTLLVPDSATEAADALLTYLRRHGHLPGQGSAAGAVG
jgi:electron transfer flavoprotein beta subunit